jgi:hypothetical protein
LFQERCEDEDEEYDEEEDEDDEATSPCDHSADLDNAENQQKVSSSSIRTPGQSRRSSLRVEFDGLSIVDEETETISNDLTPVEQCAEGLPAPPSSHQFNATRQASILFGDVKPQDGEKCAVISHNNKVNGTCFNTVNGKHGHEQFFGKIKLPNGKEGVFMSDVMLPNSNISNGLPVYGGNSLKGNSYDCGSANEFGPSDYHVLNENVWSEIPAMLPGAPQNMVRNGSATLPPPQSHYNYTFTPVDSTLLPNGTSMQDNYAFETPKTFPGIAEDEALLPNIDTCRETRSAHAYSERGENTVPQGCGLNDDTYFGMGENIQDTATASDDMMPGYYRRGGPDLFITGAYPVTRSPGSFPVGGNLDQLLRQMSNKESESVTSVPVTEVTGSETAVAKYESDREEAATKEGTENVS